ncbi:hypothetical protein C2845_PM18G11380 [Panicum miliaceum]|uniref:Receptor-like protein kinase n=1 Tax=Panicum miliaceum TaxID=4540 RepID=A0A3L6PLG7_PANMI|nr:hypothetical protein C2845_PM18G11380 [Panicum miliaceum]
MNSITGAIPDSISFCSKLEVIRLMNNSIEARRGDSDCYENRTILGIRSCVEQLAELGLKCSADSPGDRPAIHRVYAEVVAIREAFSSALEF